MGSRQHQDFEDYLVSKERWEQEKDHSRLSAPTSVEEEKPTIIAAIMAMETNIGLTKMAEATQGVTYQQIFTAQQWRLYEDSMNLALLH